MENLVYKIPLDMRETHIQRGIEIKERDNLITLEFSLFDRNKPFVIGEGCTAQFRARKPDGTVLFNACDIEGNTITYTLTNGTTSSAGVVECQLTLYDSDNNQLTSPQFNLVVDDSVCSDNEIESTNEFTALSEAFTAAEQFQKTVEDADNTVAELGEIIEEARQALESANDTAKALDDAVSEANQATESANNVASELEKKAENGDFNYVLTEQDKSEIAEVAASLLRDELNTAIAQLEASLDAIIAIQEEGLNA